jgi:hypothetical protein
MDYKPLYDSWRQPAKHHYDKLGHSPSTTILQEILHCTPQFGGYIQAVMKRELDKRDIDKDLKFQSSESKLILTEVMEEVAKNTNIGKMITWLKNASETEEHIETALKEYMLKAQTNRRRADARSSRRAKLKHGGSTEKQEDDLESELGVQQDEKKQPPPRATPFGGQSQQSNNNSRLLGIKLNENDANFDYIDLETSDKESAWDQLAVQCTSLAQTLELKDESSRPPNHYKILAPDNGGLIRDGNVLLIICNKYADSSKELILLPIWTTATKRARDGDRERNDYTTNSEF